jgi:signal transduction histidine kinase
VTLVTSWSALSRLDPRRSLGAGAMWLIIALAASFSVAAAIWVGSIAKKNLLEQHVRRLALETDQLSTDMSQALAVRLDAVDRVGVKPRAAARDVTDLRAIFAELIAEYPNLNWIAAVDAHGSVVASHSALREGENASTLSWVSRGLQGIWLGITDFKPISGSDSPDEVSDLGDLSIPVRDESSRVVGVIASHVRWRRSAHHPERLTDEPDPRITTEVYVLDKAGIVLVGPRNFLGKPWPGVVAQYGPLGTPTESAGLQNEAPRFEQLPDARRVLVSSSALDATDEVASLGWRIQLSEPNERVFQRAKAVAVRILWVSLCLGVVTCVLGILGAKHLTRRLRRLADSVTSVGQSSSIIEVPNGVDEVARLGQAFATLLGELAQERGELERRVAVRTREVERLADESKYAALVRERLTIARDLHDTLAHSMMALLSEIRFLRKLQARDPDALTKELARAETIAQEGLQEARRAISQMRVTAVRETGLGPALAELFERFFNRTGIGGDFQADDVAARFGDERAETLVRIAQEALRNIERHAAASLVTGRLLSIDEATLELKIEDNGIGFDPGKVPPGHFGIVGLREQAELIGAELSIQSKPSLGTTLRTVLRLSPAVFKPM